MNAFAFSNFCREVHRSPSHLHQEKVQQVQNKGRKATTLLLVHDMHHPSHEPTQGCSVGAQM